MANSKSGTTRRRMQIRRRWKRREKAKKLNAKTANS
ncbi:TPA: aminopeptidase [bacterium]|jgi:hypothetical protein|nr:aminopeptidase [bacterium]